MVADFQHGLVRLDEVLISGALVAAGMGFAAIWMRLGVATRRRLAESLVVGSAAAVAVFAATFPSSSWDLSENRMNSFSDRDEAALKQIHDPLRIEAHLAPQDPRRIDLEHQALAKLRRIMPGVEVRYVSATSIGLFEQTSAHYGEIWYELNGRRMMSRLTSAEGVLETIYGLAGVAPGPGTEEAIFRGHPLASPPRGAAIVFYGAWPALVVAWACVVRRRGI